MDAWSQAMIDGIANYIGDPAVEERCDAATEGIDAAIDEMLPVLTRKPDPSLLSVMLQAGLPMESIKANIKLAISGGQNEPRDAIAGTRLGTAYPSRSTRACSGRQGHMASGIRGICALDFAGRDVAAQDRQAIQAPRHRLRAGRSDLLHVWIGQSRRSAFCNPTVFDIRRDTSKSISFGAGPHFCAGAGHRAR